MGSGPSNVFDRTGWKGATLRPLGILLSSLAPTCSLSLSSLVFSLLLASSLDATDPRWPSADKHAGRQTKRHLKPPGTPRGIPWERSAS